MEEGLELKGLLSLILDMQLRLQFSLSQCNAVDKTEIIRPLLLGCLVEEFTAKTEVQLDTVVGLAAQTLAAALSQELPVAVSGEAVLREVSSGVRFGRRAEDREHEWDASADGLGSV